MYAIVKATLQFEHRSRRLSLFGRMVGILDNDR
jgi:hypothetical protein